MKPMFSANTDAIKREVILSGQVAQSGLHRPRVILKQRDINKEGTGGNLISLGLYRLVGLPCKGGSLKWLLFQTAMTLPFP